MDASLALGTHLIDVPCFLMAYFLLFCHVVSSFMHLHNSLYFDQTDQDSEQVELPLALENTTPVLPVSFWFVSMFARVKSCFLVCRMNCLFLIWCPIIYDFCAFRSGIVYFLTSGITASPLVRCSPPTIRAPVPANDFTVVQTDRSGPVSKVAPVSASAILPETFQLRYDELCFDDTSAATVFFFFFFLRRLVDYGRHIFNPSFLNACYWHEQCTCDG